MTGGPDGSFRYISRRRRPKEDRRFVAGLGRYVADIALPDMLHVALVASPYPCARIAAIDPAAALAVPGVKAVVTGAELVPAIEPLYSGLDIPKVRRYPLAVGITRHVGEWVAAVVADTRAVAEDAAELVDVAYEPLPHVVDPELAVERQQVVPGQAESTDGWHGIDTAMGPVPVVAVKPDRQIGATLI